MRRLTAITAFALFLAVPLWAQRGGGGHVGGGGGHASFGGGHMGGFAGHSGFSGGHVSSSFGARAYSGARSFSGMRASSMPAAPGYYRNFTPLPTHAGFSHSPYLSNRFGNGFRNGAGERFRTYGFRNGCRGWGCWGGGYGWGYPWWGWGYNPWLWGDWDSDDAAFDNSYQQDLANADAMNQQSLEEQQMMQQEQADGDQDVYARPPYRPPYDPPSSPSTNEAAGTSIMPATVLVFRDQKTEEVENYAIIGETLWNFAPHHTEKIPLAQLDLPATTKANDDRGVTFRLPTASEGQ